MKLRRAFTFLLAMASCSVCTLVAAQTLITQPIRLIVPYVPGGGTDTLSRLLAPYIGEEFGQQVIIDNRAGGGSTIGTQAVARAAPDGHTIGMIDAAFVSNPSLYGKLPYDTLRDFVHVSLVATAPLVLCVHPGVPATSVRELIALAKSSPGKLTFGSAGNGTGVHIAGEQLRMSAGIDIVHVPYKGAGQQVNDLLGGQTTMGFFIPSIAKAQTSGGRLRALATTGAKRTQVLPHVMSFAEVAYPGVDASTLNGIIAPAGAPADYVRRLNAVIVRSLRRQDIQDKFFELGYEIAGSTPGEFTALLESDISKLSKVIKEAGIKIDSP